MMRVTHSEPHTHSNHTVNHYKYSDNRPHPAYRVDLAHTDDIAIFPIACSLDLKVLHGRYKPCLLASVVQHHAQMGLTNLIDQLLLDYIFKVLAKVPVRANKRSKDDGSTIYRSRVIQVPAVLALGEHPDPW